MATLTQNELADIRNSLARDIAVNYVKQVVNAAIQGVENWFEQPVVKQDLSNAIDAATLPFGFTFSNAQKKQIVKQWLLNRFTRGN